MSQVRFTTCAPGDDAWWIQADKIGFDGLENPPRRARRSCTARA